MARKGLGRGLDAIFDSGNSEKRLKMAADAGKTAEKNETKPVNKKSDGNKPELDDKTNILGEAKKKETNKTAANKKREADKATADTVTAKAAGKAAADKVNDKAAAKASDKAAVAKVNDKASKKTTENKGGNRKSRISKNNTEKISENTAENIAEKAAYKAVKTVDGEAGGNGSKRLDGEAAGNTSRKPDGITVENNNRKPGAAKIADGETVTAIEPLDLSESMEARTADLSESMEVRTADSSEHMEVQPATLPMETVLTAPEKNEELRMLRISLIQPNLSQPRKHFDEESLQELADSIRQYGILQPVLVKPQGSLYELLAGERRWRAARMAGLKELPAIIRQADPQVSREIAIIENIQRADLNPLEEAMAYQSLIEEYGLTQEAVAEKVSRKRSTVTNSLRLLRLEPEILEKLRDGKITQGHARALLAVEDAGLRLKIAEKCEKENLSVREIETLVRLEGLSKNKKKQQDSEEFKQLKIIYRDLERKMKAKLGTKVSILPKDQQKGVLEIEYYSADDLDRIFTMLNSIENT